MSEPVVTVRRAGAVLYLTLNRPQARNAMSMAMVLALREALAAAEADGTLRVVVLRGAGGHFSAGADISEMATARMRLAADPNAIVAVNASFGELCADYARTGLAVVVVVEGTAMGGGFGLACVGDVTLASESAVFRLPEASLGVVPAQIAPYLVERLGISQARRLAVTGGRIDAKAAEQAIVTALHATSALRSVQVSVRDGKVRIGAFPVASLGELGRALVGVRLPVVKQSVTGPKGAKNGGVSAVKKGTTAKKREKP